MKNINDLRETLFDTIQLVKQGKLDVSKAKTVAELSQVVVNSAKVELEFIKEMGGSGTGFIESETGTVKKLERPKAEYTNNGHDKLLKQYGN